MGEVERDENCNRIVAANWRIETVLKKIDALKKVRMEFRPIDLTGRQWVDMVDYNSYIVNHRTLNLESIILNSYELWHDKCCDIGSIARSIRKCHKSHHSVILCR